MISENEVSAAVGFYLITAYRMVYYSKMTPGHAARGAPESPWRHATVGTIVVVMEVRAFGESERDADCLVCAQLGPSIVARR